jgi:hypothetical protein
VCVHTRAYTDKLHIQSWRPHGWTDRDPNWYKHSLAQSAQVMGVGARNRGGAAVPRNCEAGERARSARVYEWNMAAQGASRRAKRNLRNFRQTVRGSMRRAHVNTGMLHKRALYWQMLVVYILPILTTMLFFSTDIQKRSAERNVHHELLHERMHWESNWLKNEL